MQTIDHTVESPVYESFNVAQVAGMFDMDVTAKAVNRFRVELPDADDDWQIGLIVGPSGSGKSTIARHVYGDCLFERFDWPADKAVVDGFGDKPMKEVTHMLSSVGFSTPPAWLRPYRVLSNGERFRCDLARALLSDVPIIAFDEFTSVVDRTVAKIGSAAVSKSIRKGRIKRRFVAVTCHYDIAEWLEPDWVLDMATGQLARSRLRRPAIELDVVPVKRDSWPLFRKHHYLATSLGPTARCFVAFWGETPVAFSAWINHMASGVKRSTWREHRTVVLPDFQGVGIGNRLSETVASMFKGAGVLALSTTSHPAMIRYRSASPLWHRNRLGRASPPGRTTTMRGKQYNDSATGSSLRITGGFEYVGPAMEPALARAMLGK